MKSRVIIQRKTIEQYFTLVLFIMLCNEVCERNPLSECEVKRHYKNSSYWLPLISVSTRGELV